MNTRAKVGSDFGEITDAVTISTLINYDVPKLLFLLDQLSDSNLDKLVSVAQTVRQERTKV